MVGQRVRPIERRSTLPSAVERLVLTEVIAGQTLGQFAPGDPHETTRAVLTMCRGVSEWFRIEGAATPEQIADRYVGFALTLVLDREYVADRTNAGAGQPV